MNYLWTEDTGTGKTDKIQIRKEIFSAIENHKINSEHPNSLRCGIPETKKGNERTKLLIQSEEVQKVLLKIIN